MQNNTFSGNYGLTNDFYETFWNEIKNTFVNSVMEAREKIKLFLNSSRNYADRKDRKRQTVYKKLAFYLITRC